MSCCTAMMSARGTITSSTLRPRSARMLVSMTRSCGEKPVSPKAPFSSTVCRSARAELGFQLNSARTTRVSQLSPGSRAGGCRMTAGRFTRCALGSLRLGASVSGMAASAPRFLQSVRNRGLVPQVRIRYAEAREDVALQLFHCFGGGGGVVVVAQQVEKALHREIDEMMVERLVFFGPLARRRLVGQF